MTSGLTSPNHVRDKLTEGSTIRDGHRTMKSVSSIEKLQQTQGQNFGTSPNKHKVSNQITKSIEQMDHIPFLRQDVPYECFQHNKAFGRRHMTVSNGQPATHSVHVSPSEVQRRREENWQGYIKPISRYNEQVHPAMRVPFEKI